jgi:2-oxoglutarate ferredoxin oxidoreductase subunit beta
MVHDEKSSEPNLAYILGRMQYPEFPVPMGVFRAVSKHDLRGNDAGSDLNGD